MDAAGEVQRLLQLVEVYEDVTATFDSMAAVKLPPCLVLDTAAALAMSFFKMELAALAVHVLRLKVPEAQRVIHKAAAGEFPLLPARNGSCRLCILQQRSEDTGYSSNLAGAFGDREDRNCRRVKNLHLLQAASGYLLLQAAATVRMFQEEESCSLQADTRQALLENIQNLNMLLAATQIVRKESDTRPLLSEMQLFAQQAVGLIARSCRCLATAQYSGTAAELLSHLLQRVEPPEASVSSCHWNIRWQLAQLRAARGEWEEAQSICNVAVIDLAGAANEAPAKWRRGIEHLQLLFSALLIKCKLWTQQVHPDVLHPGSIEGGSALNKNGSPTGGSSATNGKNPQSDEAGNHEYLTESDQVGDRSSMPAKKEAGRRKRGGGGAVPSKNGASGESVVADILLLKAAELAEASLSDLLLAGEKLDAFFVAESHQAAPGAKAALLLPAASAHDSSAAGRKKGARPSAAGPAWVAGPVNPVDVELFFSTPSGA
ncbi:hypothetical protein ACSSS7_004131 [Eimeria intestinalis]